VALYSVWDWDRNAYAVYRTSTPVSVGDDPLPHVARGNSPIGADPDSDVKALPSGARFSGYSHVVRGEVRRKSSGLGDNGDDGGRGSGVTNNGWLMFALGAIASWAWWRRKSK